MINKKAKFKYEKVDHYVTGIQLHETIVIGTAVRINNRNVSLQLKKQDTLGTLYARDGVLYPRNISYSNHNYLVPGNLLLPINLDENQIISKGLQ